LLKCSECRADWAEIVNKIRGRESYVYPMLYHEFFSLARHMIGGTYLVTDRVITEEGLRKRVTYVHIPFIDLTNDLALMIQWTGSKRFDASSLESTLYKVKYSMDVKRFRSKIESCNFIHTHGRFQKVNTSSASTLVRKYMLFKSGLWRYLTTDACVNMYGQFAYTNCTSLSLIHHGGFVDNSIGFITGKPRRSNKREVLPRDVPLSAYVLRPRAPHAPVLLHEYVIDAVHIVLREGSYEGLGMRRKEIKVYSPVTLEKAGMFLLMSPKSSYVGFKPLVIGMVPEDKLPECLSAHALLYAFMFAILPGDVKARAEVVRGKYERIVKSPAGTLGVEPLPFEEVIELCQPLIDYVDNGRTLAMLKTHAALSLLGSSTHGDDYLEMLITQSSTKRAYASVGLKSVRDALRKGCSLIF